MEKYSHPDQWDDISNMGHKMIDESIQRKNLINILLKLPYVIDGGLSAQHVADFIMSDRKMVVDPLVKLYDECGVIRPDKGWVSNAKKSIDETLKNAGIE